MQGKDNKELSQGELENEEKSKEELEKEAKDLEKYEKERQRILNSAVSGKIILLRDKVAFILNNYAPARNSDIRLAWMYWRTFESHLFNGHSIVEEEMLTLSKMSSLSRVRATIQNDYKLFQADDKVKKYRGVLEEEKKQEAIEDKPSYPLYTVYIDETGKQQKYLSVGSLWITDTKNSVFSFYKLKEWKKQRNIDYEFHFAELKNHKLESYKAFFLQFLSLFPSSGFKVIIVDKSGLKINSAITDLTFHLINDGIKHENESGRAPLPRMLQVVIDNEEKGSDQIKLKNLTERLESQKIEGLVIHSFEVVDSIKSFYLQVVDLFIASINRKLNFAHSSGKAKDELADYILGLLDFDISKVNTGNTDVDKSKVFNLSYQMKKEPTEK